MDWTLMWVDFSGLNWALNIGLKSTILLLCAFAFVRIIRHGAAQHYYLLWKAVFALLLLLPFSGLLPSFVFEIVPAQHQAGQIIAALPTPYELAFPTLSSTIPTTLPLENTTPLTSENQSSSYPFIFWLGLLWASGTFLFFCLLVRELFYFQKLLRNSQDQLPLAWQNIWQEALRLMPVSIPVQIIRSAKVNIPFVFGRRRAYIFLPEEVLDWEEEKIKTVLLHELGHVQQKDFSANLMIQLVKAIYWWHPLVWRAAKETRLLCEHSCDERVLQSGLSHFTYAQHLVEIARSIHHPSSLTSIPIANNTQLKIRVSYILKNAGQSISQKYLSACKYAAILLLPLLFFNFNYYPLAPQQKSESHLIQQLSHPSTTLQIEAIMILGERRVAAAFVPLMKRLQSGDPQVRAAAVWALGKMQNKAAVPALLSLTEDQNEDVKELTLLALGEFGTAKSFYSVVKTQGHPSPDIRKATLWSLHQIGCLPAFHHIGQHLDDEEEEVRHLAQTMLVNFPKDKLREWMHKAKYNSSRQWIYEQYTGIRQRGLESLLVDCLAKNPKEKEALQHIISSNPSIEVLDELWAVL